MIGTIVAVGFWTVLGLVLAGEARCARCDRPSALNVCRPCRRVFRKSVPGRRDGGRVDGGRSGRGSNSLPLRPFLQAPGPMPGDHR